MNTQSNEIDQLFTALAKAQGAMTAASKDSANPFFKSKYADLNSVWNACREPLSANGLAIIQTVQQRESGDVLFTVLGHSSGQWVSSSLPLRIKSDGKTNELQVMGSCLSYLRRYALAAIVGVAPADEDDDGNSVKGYQVKPENNHQAQKVAPQNNQIAIKLISQEQAEELRKVIAKCSPVFKSQVDELLKERKINGFNNMGESFFKSLMVRAIQDMEAFQAIESQVAI